MKTLPLYQCINTCSIQYIGFVSVYCVLNNTHTIQTKIQSLCIRNGGEMHNYQKVILKMIESGKIPTGPGQLYSIDCKHDSWCGINKGGECNCNVDVTIRMETKTPLHTENGIKAIKGSV